MAVTGKLETENSRVENKSSLDPLVLLRLVTVRLNYNARGATVLCLSTVT